MWRSGETIAVRYRAFDGAFYAGRPLVVAADSEEVTVAWLPQGAAVSIPVAADGRNLRELPLAERWSTPRTARVAPSPNEQLLIFPSGRAHSVWVMRRDGALLGWYVNLEDPHERGERTITTRDGILDLWIPADTGEPLWKDEDELAAAVSVGRLSEEEATAIRAEGEAVIAERPWPTGWEDWRPPADWGPLSLPDGWDVSHPV